MQIGLRFMGSEVSVVQEARAAGHLGVRRPCLPPAASIFL
jgi:hypothetical protein